MELIKIGKTLKTHGYKGHLKIFIDEFYMDDFLELKAIFVSNLPYFILSRDLNSGTQAIISIEEIDSREKAQLLQGKDIFANKGDLSEIMEEDPFNEIIGFSMEDKVFGNIGKIEQVIEMPHQHLARVFRELPAGKKKEILIPLNDAYILNIDKKKKVIQVDLPDGFLEIF